MALAKKSIFDPYFVFCGSQNCYDILGVDRDADISTIKEAFRQKSKTAHPDKVHPDKKENVTEQFQLLVKAKEVLIGNESRENFNFYLDHPWSYYKATGKHAWRSLPKVHPILVSLFAMLVFSGALHYAQIGRHERAASMMKEQVRLGLSKENGGSKLSKELYDKAIDKYQTQKHAKLPGKGHHIYSPGGHDTMLRDPVFYDICDELVENIQDWGDYAYPNWKTDLFIVRAFTTYPFSLLSFGRTYFRYLFKLTLSDDDKLRLTRNLVGQNIWSDMSENERDAAKDEELWVGDNYDKWVMKKNESHKELSKRQQKLQKKAMKSKGTGSVPEVSRDLTE